ncbi:carbonic anhydrase [Basidiobolus meristosporus CBS 931.73]|uniref:Carbonic anhydrase n=1 Tax=Basidiobolus meristosporus CBS 931.73 TaxID=1314790 RepID=A0A1Y1XXJ7_9FUNG|nr:carbonic anhydrase [Basidiobolus meristosporus CBS 931.73]|eukprot:ORX90473.1 carbonic anhydrase [Basidiobolus meristosporus CBS 931.73]
MHSRLPLNPDDRLGDMLRKNKEWAKKVQGEVPQFFATTAKGQSPKILWVGCSDSRVPAEQVVQCAPGDLFVHRNIANVCLHTDLNFLSVLQYSVDVLQVEHIIVCGHYGCGGVAASTENRFHGLIDSWLCNIKDVYRANRVNLDAIEDLEARKELLVELNVSNSVYNICHSPIVQAAWDRNQPLSVHGWCYALSDGLIRELGLVVSNKEQIEHVYKMAVMERKTSIKASQSASQE